MRKGTMINTCVHEHDEHNHTTNINYELEKKLFQEQLQDFIDEQVAKNLRKKREKM